MSCEDDGTWEELTPEDIPEELRRALAEATTEKIDMTQPFALTQAQAEVFFERLGLPMDPEHVLGAHCLECSMCGEFDRDGHYQIVSIDECECQKCHSGHGHVTD